MWWEARFQQTHQKAEGGPISGTPPRAPFGGEPPVGERVGAGSLEAVTG
jgi:hypothetical protein